MIHELNDLADLSLYVPEGSSNTSLIITYVDPLNGPGTVSPPASTIDGGRTWKAQQSLNMLGLWTFTFNITGTGAGKEFTTEWVTDEKPVPWIPTLRDVADRVPARTVPVDTPEDEPKMTFDLYTVPTAEQAYRLIMSAVRWVRMRVGTVDVSLYGMAQDVAAMRTAGLVELSYPIRDANVNTAHDWLTQAGLSLDMLATTNESITGKVPDAEKTLVPIFSFPDPFTKEVYKTSKTSDWGGKGDPW